MWIKIDDTLYINLQSVKIVRVRPNRTAEMFGHENGQPVEFGDVEGATFEHLIRVLKQGGWADVGAGQIDDGRGDRYYVDLNKFSKIQFSAGLQLFTDNTNRPAYTYTDPGVIEAVQKVLS